MTINFANHSVSAAPFIAWLTFFLLQQCIAMPPGCLLSGSYHVMINNPLLWNPLALSSTLGFLLRYGPDKAPYLASMLPKLLSIAWSGVGGGVWQDAGWVEWKARGASDTRTHTHTSPTPPHTPSSPKHSSPPPSFESPRRDIVLGSITLASPSREL